MEDDKKTLVGSADDERIHNQFTAYVLIALKRRKSKYLMKYVSEKRMVISLDELLEKQAQAPGKPLSRELVTYQDALEQFLVEGALEDMICNDQLMVAILKLSDRERKILNLHLVHKMKHAEIAAILDLKTNTVEQCYARTIKKLRKDMAGEMDNEGI